MDCVMSVEKIAKVRSQLNVQLNHVRCVNSPSSEGHVAGEALVWLDIGVC